MFSLIYSFIIIHSFIHLEIKITIKFPFCSPSPPFLAQIPSRYVLCSLGFYELSMYLYKSMSVAYPAEALQSVHLDPIKYMVPLQQAHGVCMHQVLMNTQNLALCCFCTQARLVCNTTDTSTHCPTCIVVQVGVSVGGMHVSHVLHDSLHCIDCEGTFGGELWQALWQCS